MRTSLKLVSILSIVAFSLQVQATQYSRMFVFGDSLSDVGNVATTEKYNNEGRWTNALVWNEYLAQKLNIAAPKKSTNYQIGETPDAGNTNFAYGGAMASFGSTSVVGIANIHQQINERKSLTTGAPKNVGFDRYGENFKADDLVLIWGGANNLFFSANTNFLDNYDVEGERAANAMISNIEDLIAHGAQTIVALNLPDIGLTPCYFNTEGQANATLFSTTFNQNFDAGISELSQKYIDVNIIEIDAFSIFNDIVKTPEKYGIDNATGQWIEARDTWQGDSSDMPTYLFYDDVHPAEAGHKIIADAVYNAVTAIPEPAEWAAILGVIALAIGLIFKRRFRN